MTEMSLIFLPPFAGLLLGAAVQDMRTRTISNGWPAAMLLLFVIAWPLGAVSGPILSHLIHFALALGVGMLLFALGWFGGGDAKLYAATALWFPLAQALFLFVSVALVGLVLAIAHLGFHFVRKMGGMKDSKLPYGVAIAIGAIIALTQTS